MKLTNFMGLSLVSGLIALTPTLASAAPRLPNLTVSVEVRPNTLQAGDTATVSAVVSNRGLGTAYNAGYNLLLPGGISYSILRQPGGCEASRVGNQIVLICMDTVLPGGNSVLELSVGFPATGSYPFSSSVDPSNMIRETRESDNDAVLTVDVM